MSSSNNSWGDIGEKIRDTVQNAVDSKDFKELNETIGKVINVAFKSAKDSVNTAAERNSTKRRWQQVTNEENRYHNVVAFQNEDSTVLYARRPRGSISGVISSALGFSALGIFAISALSFLVAGLSTIGTARIGFMMVAGLMTIFGTAGLVVGLKGTSTLKRIQRFRQYVQLMGNHEYIAIQDLADKAGKSRSYVLKDLQEMIQQGMFLNGHIDSQKTHLITSDEAYEQYNLMQKGIADKQAADEVARQEANRLAANPKLTEECRKIISEGKAYIAHIKQCNDDIPDEEFSNKLERLEEIMKRIFIQLEKQPQEAPELHKFMNYYLPTTTKLIDAYRDIDEHKLQGDNIQSTKREIEDTLDTINDAFEKLFDRFFQDTAWDISSDISVMKTMLKQEGLTEDDLTINSKKANK